MSRPRKSVPFTVPATGARSSPNSALGSPGTITPRSPISAVNFTGRRADRGEAPRPAAMSAPPPPLQSERQRLLEQLPHASEELGAVGSVQDPVVADERRAHHVARDDPPALVHHR